MNWIYSIVKFLSIYVAFDVELKSYQKDVLNSFKAWMGHLNTCKEYSESTDLKIATQFKNYPEQAWIRLKNENKIPGDKNHINRQSNAKSNSRPIPNICLQVPTGGGKTILGIHAIKEWGLTNTAKCKCTFFIRYFQECFLDAFECNFFYIILTFD